MLVGSVPPRGESPVLETGEEKMRERRENRDSNWGHDLWESAWQGSVGSGINLLNSQTCQRAGHYKLTPCSQTLSQKTQRFVRFLFYFQRLNTSLNFGGKWRHIQRRLKKQILEHEESPPCCLLFSLFSVSVRCASIIRTFCLDIFFFVYFSFIFHFILCIFSLLPFFFSAFSFFNLQNEILWVFLSSSIPFDFFVALIFFVVVWQTLIWFLTVDTCDQWST